MRGLEPRTLRMQSARSTAELHPHTHTTDFNNLYLLDELYSKYLYMIRNDLHV